MAHSAPHKLPMRGQLPNGPKIRALRIDRGWSVEELARRAELSPATIQSLERGDGLKYLSTFASVAAALDVRPGELYQEAGPAPAANVASELAAKKIALTVTIVSINVGDVDDTKPLPKIVRDLIEALGGEDKVTITGLAPGSAVLDLEADELQVCSFLAAYCAGRFYPDIPEVTCADSSAIRRTIALATNHAPPSEFEQRYSSFGFYSNLLEISPTEIARLEAFADADSVELTLKRWEPPLHQSHDPQRRRSDRGRQADE